MHTETNTNIDIIKNNYAKLPDEKKGNPNCVLLITGSFNPIHRFHIQNLLTVQEHLGQHQVNVLAAYISPTHDGYVRPKLGASEWITGEKRCELCEKAIEEQGCGDFIAVAKGEMECKHGFVDFDEVSIQLAQFLNVALHDHEVLSKHPLKVVYVCGLDHFNKCSYVEHLAKGENMGCAVLYRPGASESRIKSLSNSSSNFYYIKPDADCESLVDVSSTAIRQHYRSGNNFDTHQASYSCVAEYYKDKFSTKV